MKQSIRILTLLTCIIIRSSITHAEPNWELIYPHPDGNNLRDLHIFDKSTAITTGYNGTILKTTDGGEKWEKNPVSDTLSERLNAVYFTDAQTGWIAGENGILLHTTDGGDVWHKIETGRVATFKSVYFTDSSNGWVAGNGDYILHTGDGGATWQEYTNGLIDNVEDIHFIDPATGWIVGGNNKGKILTTTDSGQTWNVQHESEMHILHEIEFSNDSTAIAAGTDGTVLHTEDAGASWTELGVSTGRDLYGLYMDGTDTVIVTGEGGVIIQSYDGGNSWDNRTTGSAATMYGIQLTGKQGWAVGQTGLIYATEDYGDSWHMQRSDSTWSESIPPLIDVHFVDENKGWVVGDKGRIMYTGDGGDTWDIQTSGTEVMLHSVHFANDSTGWIAGNEGVILHTVNGGESWQEQTTPVDHDLYSLAIANAQQGWATGDEGTILRTEDGGDTWNRQEDITAGARLFSIHAINESEAWVTVRGGLMHTINGGDTWDKISTPSKQYLYDVFFVDNQTGWIAGTTPETPPTGWGGCEIIHTSDGGSIWNVQLTYDISHIHSLFFINKEKGWASFTTGTIFSTINGGSIWNKGTADYGKGDIFSLYFVNDSSGWAVGDNSLTPSFLIPQYGDKGYIYRYIGGSGEPVNALTQEKKDVFTTLAIYPNPASGKVRIESDIETYQKVNISILDLTGRRVFFEKSAVKRGQNAITINVEALNPGVYVVMLESQNGESRTGKLFIKR